MRMEVAPAARAAAMRVGGPTVLPVNAWQARHARAHQDRGGARAEPRKMTQPPDLHFQVPNVAASYLLLSLLAQWP